MKKLLTRSTALIMCALMCISLAACGKSKTVESYISSNQDAIDTMVATMEAQAPGVSIDVTAKDTTMVFNFTYVNGVDSLGWSVEDAKTALDAQLDLMESQFSGLLAELKKEVSSAECIQVNYLDKDGSTITSRDFKE